MIETSLSSVTLREWQKLQSEIEILFQEQWQDPELPAMEYRSASRLADWLARYGFEVERPAGGLPTAFVARTVSGKGPTIALLAEYDALPGLDNDAAPVHRPLGKAAGHACGHNHIGPANAGAAIAAALACRELKLKGEIRVIGCPAEELLWGKIALLRAGVFSGIDAILTSHGDYQTGALSRPCQSVVSGEFVFTGEAGHGGQSVQRNALLAAEETVTAVKSLLAKEYPDVLLRHVLRQAGVMPSITPFEARVWFSTRTVDFVRARQAYREIRELAEEHARQRRMSFRHQFISESRGYLPNDTLCRVIYEAMMHVGPPNWSQADLTFMSQLAQSCVPGEELQLDRGVHHFDSGEDYYGQDDGEVSWRIPLGRANWAYPTQIPIHHWAWTALSGHRASHPGPLAVSQALAIASTTLLSSPDIVEESKKELNSRVKGVTLTEPQIGAIETLTQRPETFWSGSWRE